VRAQDRRTSGYPVTLDGTVIRIAASTLASLPSGTPALTSNAGRIMAGSGCVSTGSAAAGAAFYDPAGNYPAAYDTGCSSPTTPAAASG
jgi:hypothetical protein